MVHNNGATGRDRVRAIAPRRKDSSGRFGRVGKIKFKVAGATLKPARAELETGIFFNLISCGVIWVALAVPRPRGGPQVTAGLKRRAAPPRRGFAAATLSRLITFDYVV